jgi:hypothetical protein
VHDVEPIKALLLQTCKERHNFVGDESGVCRRDKRTFDVLFLEPDTKRVDALKRLYSVLEIMIYHADERYLVVQDASNLLETGLTFPVSIAATVERLPKLEVELIIPKVRKADPISIVACGSIRETKLVKLVLFRIEDNLDVIVATHGPH